MEQGIVANSEEALSRRLVIQSDIIENYALLVAEIMKKKDTLSGAAVKLYRKYTESDSREISPLYEIHIEMTRTLCLLYNREKTRKEAEDFLKQLPEDVLSLYKTYVPEISFFQTFSFFEMPTYVEGLFLRTTKSCGAGAFTFGVGFAICGILSAETPHKEDLLRAFFEHLHRWMGKYVG